MPVRAISLLATLALVACSGGAEPDPSKPADPSVIFEIPPPNVNEDWPCPPFGTPTTEADLDDSDGDLLANCQELTIGTNPAEPDSDGDGFDDYAELGDGGLVDPLDTDRDGDIDSNDADDDGDLVASSFEGPEDDYDADGKPNHLDNDDDGDAIYPEDPDGDGDATNDDTDGDGILNFLDTDDDGDGVESVNENDDDADGDGVANNLDTDDDGDGVVSDLEDADGDGDPLNDDLDGDGDADFIDPDEDGDDVPNASEDLDGDGSCQDHDSDGDGTVDYRDSDDDNDGVIVESDPATKDPVATRDFDSDGDGRPNYRDADDDADGCLTVDEFDPKAPSDDHLDDTVATCATPVPEVPATYSLVLSLHYPALPPGGPPAPTTNDLLISVEGGAAAVESAGTISGDDQVWTITGLEPGADLTVNVSVDLDTADGECNAGTDEETMWSWVVSGLAVVDYDLDATVDLDLLTVTDTASGTSVALDVAACAANGP